MRLEGELILLGAGCILTNNSQKISRWGAAPLQACGFSGAVAVLEGGFLISPPLPLYLAR